METPVAVVAAPRSELIDPQKPSLTSIHRSDDGHQADDETEEEENSDSDNFPDPYEQGLIEEYSAFRVDDGAEDDDDDDEEETPQVTLKLPKLTEVDKFARALENAEDMSYEEHYFIVQNAQQALVAWQDEFMRLDRYIAKRETGEDKDGVPVVRNPRALRYTGQAYQDRLEADVYGYEHNPHPSKIGSQDPIKQRVTEGRSSRALRDRINPTKKAAEGDDTTSPDDEETPGASTPLDDSFHIRDEVELSNSGRPLRIRNLSRQASLSRDSTPVATFPSGKRIGRPPKKLLQRQEHYADARSGAFSVHGTAPTSQPKRKGGRPSNKELERRAALAAAEARLKAAREAQDDEESVDQDETRSNSADSVDRMATRSITHHVHPGDASAGRKRYNTSEFEEPPAKKNKGGRPRKVVEEETSEVEQSDDRSQRLSKGQKASWAKDAGQRRLAQSQRMKEKWDRVRAADPNAKSLAGSKNKPEPPAILPPIQPIAEPPKKNKGGRPKKIKPEDEAQPFTPGPGSITLHLNQAINIKRKREDEEDQSAGVVDPGEQPIVKKKKGGRPRKHPIEDVTSPSLFGVINPQDPAPVTGEVVKKNKGGRPRKIRPEDTVQDDKGKGHAAIPFKGEEAEDGDADTDQDPEIEMESQDVKPKGRGGRPKKDAAARASETVSTPQVVRRRASIADASAPSYTDLQVQTPSEFTGGSEDQAEPPLSAPAALKAASKKSKSEKMKAIMKARWQNGEMNKVMEKKKANAAARRKAAGEASAKKKVAKPTPPTQAPSQTPELSPAIPPMASSSKPGPKPARRRTIGGGESGTSSAVEAEVARQLASTGRKLSEYEEFQALSSPVNSPLGRRGRRTAALRASASFSRLDDTEEEGEDVERDLDDDDIDVEEEDEEEAITSAHTDSEIDIHQRRRPSWGARPDSSRGRQALQVEDSDDAPNRQLGTEYDQFQAVGTPGSTVVLGKRKRKPVVNLEEAMKIEAEDEFEDEYTDDVEE